MAPRPFTVRTGCHQMALNELITGSLIPVWNGYWSFWEVGWTWIIKIRPYKSRGCADWLDVRPLHWDGMRAVGSTQDPVPTKPR